MPRMALISRLFLSCGLGHHPAHLSPTEDKKPYFKKSEEVATDSNENEIQLLKSNNSKKENGFFRESFRKKHTISPLAAAVPNGKNKPRKKTDSESKDKDRLIEKYKDNKPLVNRSMSVQTNTDAKSQTSQRSRAWTITKQHIKRIRRRKKDVENTDGQCEEDEQAKAERKNEYLYAQVLQAVVNPLGAPDSTPGHRPLELATHLQRLFDIDPIVHDKWMRDVQNNRPSNIVLNATVVEAQDLQNNLATGVTDTYCLLCLVNQRSKSSPKGSPRGSPSSRRRKSSVDHTEVRKTQVVKANLNPQWNEKFELEVTDFHTQDLELYVWNNEEPSSTPRSDRPSTLRTFLRHLRNTVDLGRPGEEFVGQLRIPLRDVPAKGLDKWFDLYSDKKKMKTAGRCRLRLDLSVKQGLDQLDCAESDQCSVDDYYRIVKQIYEHAVKDLIKDHEDNLEAQREFKDSESDEELPNHPSAVFHGLPDRSRSILDQFAVQQHFSRLSQLLVDLVIILELAKSENLNCQIPDKLVKEAIANLEQEWLIRQRCMKADDSVLAAEEVLLTVREMTLFEFAASNFVEKRLRNLTDIPQLFPPCDLQLEDLNNKVSLLVDLLNLHIWTKNESAKKDLSAIICQQLQANVKEWATSRLEKVYSAAKEPVIPEIKLMVQILRCATNYITPIYSVTQYFSRIGIDYFKVVSLACESRLALKSQELMLKMDKYQVNYQKYRVNIKESSGVSLQLYFALRNLFHSVKSNITERELFRLTVTNYQQWFDTAIIFWLQTFREEGIRRMEKALEIDKDVVQVTSLVKFSNSSVDVLSVFSKMTTEWRQIDFADADICLLGVTKITDTICDGAREYGEKIESMLERNCYYDLNDVNHFDVTDQLCITMNNIEHVRTYLQQLPELLGFDLVTQAMTIKHEDDHIGKQALKTLHSLVASANEDIAMRLQTLMSRITDKMSVELRRYTEKFTKTYPTSRSSVDPLLHYLETNLQVLFERLEATIFPKMLQQIWVATLECFNSSMLNGRAPEYYEEMMQNLKSLKAYFYRSGTYGDVLREALCDQIIERLKLNIGSTEDLILDYLKSLNDTEENNHSHAFEGQFNGQLAIRTGYVEETGNNVSIHATVVGGQRIRGVNRKGLSDVFVNISLLPPRLLRNRPVRTRTIKATSNPDFNETFSFNCIPKYVANMPGAVMVFTVWHEDGFSFLPNDVLGEFIIPLKDLQDITPHQSIEDMPTSLMPICNHPEPQDGPYQVLRERAEWDKQARSFLSKRRVMAGYESSVPLCKPMKCFMGKFFRKQPPAEHCVYGSPPTL